MASKTQAKPKSSGGLKNIYLLAYNLVSAGLWFSVLFGVVQIASKEGVESGKVYEGLEEWARLVQTGAVLEVLHSLLGMFCPGSIVPFATAPIWSNTF